jgi:hypothetical protein
MRPRLLLPAALAALLAALVLALPAGASRTESGAASPVEAVNGWDWVGRVSLGYQFPSRDDRGHPTRAMIVQLTFANECSKRGSLVNASITVDRRQRFHYRGRGFTVTGNVIGRPGNPREVAGFASVDRGGCASGPWWFDAYPAPLG